ncbi:UNVERIFIED_ORG: hypothetical protein J2W85_006741 [Ensifer adhaerens]|nr:hypothetical protein [Ensifer adhaerens]
MESISAVEIRPTPASFRSSLARLNLCSRVLCELFSRSATLFACKSWGKARTCVLPVGIRKKRTPRLSPRGHCERLHSGNIISLVGAVVADWTVEILVAEVVRRVGCGVAPRRLRGNTAARYHGPIRRRRRRCGASRSAWRFSPSPSARLPACSRHLHSCHQHNRTLETVLGTIAIFL